MKEIIVAKNDASQRMDRFLKKYLSQASKGFIYKMLRKKNIVLNGKRADPDTIIEEGDIVGLYLSDETIMKFKKALAIKDSRIMLDAIYEDKNIILINKQIGVLSHSDGDIEDSIVDGMISYLYKKGEYNPEIENTFKPAICNRLDRNTGGIIIGAKNYLSLKSINASIRKRCINRYYKTIVKGIIENDMIIEGFLSKDGELNKVSITEDNVFDSRGIKTIIRPLKVHGQHSLIEAELVTGRTHQIRAHLAYIGYPIIGDAKYGCKYINKSFRDAYMLNNQFLYAYRIRFEKIDAPLDYLTGREFVAKEPEELIGIEKALFDLIE